MSDNFSEDKRFSQFSEAHLKHLDLIQAVITRLSNSGSLVKGWAITLAGVFFGLAVNTKEPALALISIVPTLAFWGLDIYYLRSERLFRLFYDRARQMGAGYQPLDMDATDRGSLDSLTDEQRVTVSWLEIAKRPTLRVLYVGLLLAAILVAGFSSAFQTGQHSAGCERSPHRISHLIKHC